MDISDEKMNGNVLPVKLNLVLVLREKSNLLLMMLSDLLNISTALKFKCHLRAFREAPVQGRERLNLTLVKSETMSNGHSFILPPGGVTLSCAQKLHQSWTFSLASIATPPGKTS